MTDLLDIIGKVCKEAYEPMVQSVFGDAGVDSVFRIMEIVRTLYKHVEPERIQGEVIIFEVMRTADATPSPILPEPAVDFAGLANQLVKDLILEVARDGRVYLRPLHESAIPTELAKKAVVYWYKAGSEAFLAGSQTKVVTRYDPAARSQFCVPTLANLREALQHYAVENVRESTCYIFERVWRDQNRLFLEAKPEANMRRSLTQFLRNRIGGDHDVIPEQNVDESHPVDIRITPKFSNNRMMLIEIKWLGDSVAPDGHITASHRDSRAQEGAEQLAGYLENQRRFAPSHVIHGYYVIIDARRKNLREGTTTITRVNGLHFEDKDILFQPAPHETRTDFDRPYRMFARPICCD
jgi:hypothetical protein